MNVLRMCHPSQTLRCWLLACFIILAAACSRSPQPVAENFVGQWQSSRMASRPVHLHANGEWEIKSEDGHVMQYGVWKIQGKRMIWTVRINGRIDHDENTIVSFRKNEFELTEQDGSVTKFQRID